MTTRDRVKVAAIQMTSSDDATANMATARRLLEQAAEAGAQIALLPENVALMGRRESDKFAIAEDEGAGPLQQALSDAARQLGLWVIGGTLPIKVSGESRVAAAVLVFDSSGQQVARYDKMHLFDVSVAERGETYRESASIAPGTSPVVVDTPAGRLGLSVCYDLRFPELFRSLVASGANWFVVPAAFTVPTGRAHWETLLRARAIENLAYVVAAGQTGLHANGRETYGDSMVVDHWGSVQARLPHGEGVVVAEFDLEAQAQVRAEFPALSHRRI
ncbi:MAG: carbon-nitrogen hydrolase family protein [Steroidobacteraceae bacterium]|jgi:nitrilase